MKYRKLSSCRSRTENGHNKAQSSVFSTCLAEIKLDKSSEKSFLVKMVTASICMESCCCSILNISVFSARMGLARSCCCRSRARSFCCFSRVSGVWPIRALRSETSFRFLSWSSVNCRSYSALFTGSSFPIVDNLLTTISLILKIKLYFY